MFKPIITPQAHPCKTFIYGRESLPAQSSTQDMTSSQGFAAPLPLSTAPAPGWLGRACTPTTDPKGWVMHQPPQRQTGNSAPNYTQSKRKFLYTQDGSDFDGFKDQPHTCLSHCDPLCSFVHQDLPAFTSKQHHTETVETIEKHVAVFPNTLQKMWQIIWKA